MAGQGETCSHVGAVLYWLETHVRIREETACTSKENTWMMPTPVKDILYLMLKEIEFTTAETKMKCSEKPSVSPEIPLTTCKFDFPTEDELSSFLSEIAKKTVRKPAIVPPYTAQFIDPPPSEGLQ